jgi:hypothetical protein
VPAREAAHLLQALDRNGRGEPLALALDDELLAQPNPIERSADPLSDVEDGDLLGHAH